MDGIGNALQGLFEMTIVFFIIAILGVGYFLYNIFGNDDELVSKTIIIPELKLTIKNNKVDTLYVYKLKK